jgi:ABC-2 type transport system permease protein
VIAQQARTIRLVFILHLKQVAVDLFVIFTVIIQPLIVATLAIFMLRDTEGFEAIFVIVGSGLTGLWSGTLFFSAFNINAERWTGTLESIVASPTSLMTVVIGKSLANTVMSVSSMIFGYALVSNIFDFELNVANTGAFMISLILGLASLVSLGLVIAPFMSMNLGAHVWVNAMEFPVFTLAGFLFPIALLPAWVTPISYLLAPYWAARALHETSSGAVDMNQVLFSWSMLILFTALNMLLSRALFKKLLFKARVDATLGLQ